jgi:hypothetical protein
MLKPHVFLLIFGGSSFLETFLEEVLTSFALFALAFGFDVLATFF